MCFAFGFQQNHALELGNLVKLVRAARVAGRKPFVDLDLLTAASTMQEIIEPVRLLALVDMAQREISGRFGMTELCEHCHGDSENYQESEPEDIDPTYQDLLSCSFCNGSGFQLSIEAMTHFGLLDKKAWIAALSKCRLSDIEAQLALQRFRRNSDPLNTTQREKKPIFTIWLC